RPHRPDEAAARRFGGAHGSSPRACPAHPAPVPPPNTRAPPGGPRRGLDTPPPDPRATAPPTPVPTSQAAPRPPEPPPAPPRPPACLPERSAGGEADRAAGPVEMTPALTRHRPGAHVRG